MSRALPESVGVLLGGELLGGVLLGTEIRNGGADLTRGVASGYLYNRNLRPGRLFRGDYLFFASKGLRPFDQLSANPACHIHMTPEIVRVNFRFSALRLYSCALVKQRANYLPFSSVASHPSSLLQRVCSIVVVDSRTPDEQPFAVVYHVFLA